MSQRAAARRAPAAGPDRAGAGAAMDT
ncbi:MAG: hypothetical protein QOJ82_985, partial [Solirubrobacteraceae bacterium]|nr:hypothetical protein [Solirubrobacteraceae bacterium]